MNDSTNAGADVDVQRIGHVGHVEILRGPHNFLDETLLCSLADALVGLDAEPEVRAIVLCAQGRNFCAGADLREIDERGLRRVYRAASPLFTTRKPIVAAVQGAAIGGGLGLALAADFRVGNAGTRFAANFARLGFHHGFGLSVTLPAVVGRQNAMDLLYTGRPVEAAEARALGLLDRLADGDVRTEAHAWATEIAGSAPRSLVAIRATLRRDLAAAVVAALDVEATAQAALLGTADFREGVAASIVKRAPEFSGA